MKTDKFCKRFLFVPIIVIAVSILCIAFNVYERFFPDEEKEYVEIVEDAKPEKTAEKYKAVKKIKSGEALVDINHASVEELMQLPGIGATKANEIVDIRKRMGGFRTINDLMCTEGIGPGVFENLKDFITITEY